MAETALASSEILNVSSELVACEAPDFALPEHVMAMLPCVIVNAGERTSYHFVEFFAASIHNPNTRKAYARAVMSFLRWCDNRGLSLRQITPVVIAAYLREHTGSPQSVKQHLTAIRMLFSHLVRSQVLPVNPAASVRGPKYVIKKGKTPVLSAEDTRHLLDSIDTAHVVSARPRLDRYYGLFLRAGGRCRENECE